MQDYTALQALADTVKKAFPGNPWFYQEGSDAYTHIVRVENPELNNSLIVAQMGSRTDGISEALARYLACLNPDALRPMLAELREAAALREELLATQNSLSEMRQAYDRLNAHNNECEHHLDSASALLVEIAKGGHSHQDCSNPESSTAKQIAELAEYVAQFQPAQA